MGWKKPVAELLESRRLLSSYFVDSNPAIATRTGDSWDSAYADLQQAIAVAMSGDEIRVADGIYAPGTARSSTFNVIDGVSLRGSFAGFGAVDPNAQDFSTLSTIISGEIGNPASALDNCYHVLTCAPFSSLIEGFTITGGRADVNGNYYGGGMYCKQSAGPAIRNCRFEKNYASRGGGVYGYARVTDCTFFANSASEGGALYIPNNATVLRCLFQGNVADAGAGVFVYRSATVSIINSAFAGNSADAGSVAYNYTQSSTDSVTTKFINCTLVGNYASVPGSVERNVDSRGAFENINCILWHNFSLVGDDSPDSVDPVLFRNPSAGGDGIVATADDDYGDLRIRAASPAVDAGNNALLPLENTTDLAGNDRFQDVPTTPDSGVGTSPIVDVGAYEASPSRDASAGGPYSILQSAHVVLKGRGASAQPGALQYAWEWSGDGQFNEASTSSVDLPTSSFAPGTLLNLQLRVTDASGVSTYDSTTLRIAPVVAYVDARATSGANSGESWGNAFTSLADALNHSLTGQTFRVATGTYTPTTTPYRNFAFMLRKGVAVNGGYAGLGASNPDERNATRFPTNLSGDIGIAGTKTDNSTHVLIGAASDLTSVLDGLTITAGNALSNDGGGIYLPYGAITIRNCAFTKSDASYGGGVALEAGTTANISNCTFAANFAFYYGGGVHVASGAMISLSNCSFSGNSAYSGGGGGLNTNSANTTIDTCHFRENTSSSGGAVFFGSSGISSIVNCSFAKNTAGNGGAVFATGSAKPTLSNCTFDANQATGMGGVIYSSSSSPQFADCKMQANTASSGGAVSSNKGGPSFERCRFYVNTATNGSGGAVYDTGGLSAMIFRSCAFVGNTASQAGGACGNYDAAETFNNCTFVANSAGTTGGAFNWNYSLQSVAQSCIFWNNSAPSGAQIYPSNLSNFQYSCIQGGYQGTGNTSDDPMLVRLPSRGADGTWGTSDDDLGDVRLRASSPCIDSGTNAYAVSLDLDALPRTVNVPGIRDPGAITDRGAYEYQIPSSMVQADFIVDGIEPTLRFAFNGDVAPASLSGSDLTIIDSASHQMINPQLVHASYDDAYRTAIVGAGVLPDGNYSAYISGGVQDVLGLSMTTGPAIQFFFLNGDANRDRLVDTTDFNILAANFGTSNRLFSQGDFNYDQAIDSIDFSCLLSQFGKRLAICAPSLSQAAPLFATFEGSSENECCT
jgi:hypothetical protein